MQSLRWRPVIIAQRAQIAELAIKSRLPAIYEGENMWKPGGYSYGVSITDLDRRAATYVVQILKGANRSFPSSNRKVRVHHHLKAAKQIGLTITAERADASRTKLSDEREQGSESVVRIRRQIL